MHCYCTLFDKNYLSRGLALYFSLQRQEPGVKVVLLCLDSATRDAGWSDYFAGGSGFACEGPGDGLTGCR